MSDEKILFKGASSAVVNLGLFLLCAAVFITALIASFVVAPPWNYALWGAAGLTFVYAVVRWMLIRFRIYEVTTERIRLTTGILTRRTDELELYRVKDVTLVEPLSMRVFGCGNIVVTTHDASTPRLELTCIRGGRAVREEMRTSIEACRDRKGVRVAEFE